MLALLGAGAPAAAAPPDPRPRLPAAVDDAGAQGHCRDLGGVSRARRWAVRRGADWLIRYVVEPAHLARVSVDAVALLAELGLTARDALVGARALAAARALAPRVAAPLLAPGALDDPAALRQALWLLALAQELGAPPGPLLRAAKARFDALPAPTAVYDIDVARIDGASSDEAYWVLVGAHALERARLAFPGHFEAPFGLREALAAVARRRWLGYDEDRSRGKEGFREDAYLITHVGFVLNDYGRLALPADRLPRLGRYLDAHLGGLLARRDLELVAEILDLARSAGADEGSDPRLCRATRLLLSSQGADGSWGDWRREADPYDAIHPTWTAVHALRERGALRGTPFARRVAEILDGIGDL